MLTHYQVDFWTRSIFYHADNQVFISLTQQMAGVLIRTSETSAVQMAGVLIRTSETSAVGAGVGIEKQLFSLANYLFIYTYTDSTAHSLSCWLRDGRSSDL